VSRVRGIAVATSQPRPGRRFEPIQELELHDDALDAAKTLPGASRGLVVVSEFAGPLGIPDFTAFVGQVTHIRTRQNLTIAPIVNEVEAGIVSVAHVNRPSSAEQLAQALGWPSAIVAGRVPRLVKSGALAEVARGRYTRPMLLEPAGRLYAIEAKVNDWRSALRQVRTYRVWADAYVIVMGSISVQAQEALTAEVRHDRGGLVVAGKWVMRPRLGPVPTRRRIEAWERFASATPRELDDPSLALRIHS
jgi:hypothetical protein